MRPLPIRTDILNPPPQSGPPAPVLRQRLISDFLPGVVVDGLRPIPSPVQPPGDTNTTDTHSTSSTSPRLPLSTSPRLPLSTSPRLSSPTERPVLHPTPTPPDLPLHVNLSNNSTLPRFNTRTLSGSTPSRRQVRTTSRLQSSQHFGDPWPRPKNHRHLRLSFANVNGFETSVYANQSVSRLRHWLRETDTDIFLGCEAKINWGKMPFAGQLSQWFQSGEALRTVHGYNTHEAHLNERRQFGGTFGLAFGQVVSHITATGCDLTGLGRWSWFRCSSPNTPSSIRIVVAYRPVRQPRSQLLSTYMQHSRFLSSHRDFMCPRRAFFRDLAKEITTWQLEGDQILLAGDFNEPVNNEHIIQFFASLHMVNILSQRHPSDTPASTHTRGSTVIDAVWASSALSCAAGTWLSFETSPADHRSLVLDFDWNLLFGTPSTRIQHPHGRRLNARLPLVRETYNRLLEKFLSRANFPQRALTLCLTDWSQYPPSALHTYLEHMDQIRSEGMLFAEHRCRRYHTGMVFFSPEINRARQLRDLYKLLLQRLRGRRMSRSRITSLAKKCQIRGVFQLHEAEVLSHFYAADAQYRSLKPRSADLREDYLRQKLTDPHTLPSSLQAIQTMMRHEQQRTAFRILRHLEGKTQASRVTSVQEDLGTAAVPHIVTHSDRSAIEQALTSCLKRRFCLASSTPLLQPDVLSRLGSLGWTSAAADILSGAFDCASLPLSPASQRFLQGLRHPDPALPAISTSISRDDFIRYWRKAKESTSSSFSGLHFGHYKAATHSPFLSDIHALLTETSFRAGYPLLRWQHGLQVILEKKPGVRLVSKLRAILLMEADFNFGNKLLIGSRMMKQARTSGSIPPELYGGVKGKRADLMALSRRLYLDILRQKRRPAAIASVDAESCYDRISHTAASLACQRWGVPPPVMITMLQAIQRMQFHLRTGFGDASAAYSSDPDHLFQGICQGNGAGPAVWLAISSCLVNILNSSLPCTPLLGPLSSTSLSISGFLFVDDTDLIFAGSSADQSATQIIEQLQQRITLWEQLLHASGGAISWTKCTWSLLSFLQTSPSLVLQNSLAVPGSIAILPSSIPPAVSRPARLKRLEPWESCQVVGVVQACNGSMKGQIKSLRSIADLWTHALSTHSLPRHLAWVALRSKIWASLRYPLTCTTLSKREGHFIVSRLYQQVLPKLGAARSLPNAYKYGSAKLQGLSLPHPYYFQGASQVSTLVHLFFSPSIERNALHISWEHLQLQLGTATPFLSLSFDQWGFLATPCWLTSLWQFTSTYAITVEGFPSVLPPVPRVNDRYIMDVLVNEGGLARGTLMACNRVRMSLHALTFTDIITGDGFRLRPLLATPNPTCPPSAPSTFEWPPLPFPASILVLGPRPSG